MEESPTRARVCMENNEEEKKNVFGKQSPVTTGFSRPGPFSLREARLCQKVPRTWGEGWLARRCLDIMSFGSFASVLTYFQANSLEEGVGMRIQGKCGSSLRNPENSGPDSEDLANVPAPLFFSQGTFHCPLWLLNKVLAMRRSGDLF